MNYDKRNAIVFFPGFDRVTGSAGSVFFLKNQNDVILVYKKKVNGFATGSCRVTPGFSFSRFFFNPARFQPQINRIPDQPTGSGRFQNYASISNFTNFNPQKNRKKNRF